MVRTLVSFSLLTGALCCSGLLYSNLIVHIIMIRVKGDQPRHQCGVWVGCVADESPAHHQSRWLGSLDNVMKRGHRQNDEMACSRSLIIAVIPNGYRLCNLHQVHRSANDSNGCEVRRRSSVIDHTNCVCDNTSGLKRLRSSLLKVHKP